MNNDYLYGTDTYAEADQRITKFAIYLHLLDEAIDRYKQAKQNLAAVLEMKP